MATLGAESTRPLGSQLGSQLGSPLGSPLGSQLGSSPSVQSHLGGASLPPNRGLERALEEAVANGVLKLSSRKLKEFPRTACDHDLSDTVDAGDDTLIDLLSIIVGGAESHWASCFCPYVHRFSV